MKKVSIKSAVEFLSSMDNYLIFTHANPDGDTIGSAAALTAALRIIGKKAWAVNSGDVPDRLKFICDDNVFLNPIPESLNDYTVISVDIASPAQIGEGKFRDINFALSIDHHMINRLECERLLLCPDYVSAGEIVYKIIKALGVEVDKNIALPLYASISSDSGGFRYAGTRPQTHLIAAKLLATKIDFAKINRLLFETKSTVQIALEHMAYERLELLCGGKFGVVVINEEDFSSLNASDCDVESLNNIPRQVAGVEVSALIRPWNGISKISLRSNEYYNVAQLAASFGGGGHIHAAGCRMDCNVAEAKNRLLDVLSKSL